MTKPDDAKWGIIYGLLLGIGFRFGTGIMLLLQNNIYYIAMLIISILITVGGLTIVKLMKLKTIGMTMVITSLSLVIIFIEGLLGISLLSWFGVTQLVGIIIIVVGFVILVLAAIPIKVLKVNKTTKFVVLAYAGYIMILLAFPEVFPYTKAGIIL